MYIDSIINVKNLSYYRGKKVILNNINVKIPKGKITAIMGPSGCGKTTFLSLISAELEPNSGVIDINNRNIFSMKQDELYDLRKNIGMLYQNSALFTDLTVFDNIAFPIKEHTSLNDDMIFDLVLMKLISVGLEDTFKMMPYELSVGMAKRVALARAVALDPKIIIYDEPFAGQDPISIRMLIKLIKIFNKLGSTTIIVSHDVYETINIVDYVYLIFEGDIIVGCETKDLFKNKHPIVKQFIRGFY